MIVGTSSAPIEEPAETSPPPTPEDHAVPEEEPAVAKPRLPAIQGKAKVQWVFSNAAGIYFARTETTVAQFAACVAAGACDVTHTTGDGRGDCNLEHPTRSEYPVICANWYGAKEYCDWVGGRLPTNGEWHAEASNNAQRRFPWGNRVVTCVLAIWGDGRHTDGCGMDGTWPVCSKTVGNSVSGLCDMSGNVWEWTSTRFDSQEDHRVIRGGSWYDDSPPLLGASSRVGLGCDSSRERDRGFRCAKDIK